MNHAEYLDKLRTAGENLRKDPAKLKAFLRSVMGPPTRTLEGKEKEQIMLLLAMLDPFKQTNNQHSWTDYYMIGETEYHATYFPEDKDAPILDVLLEEEE